MKREIINMKKIIIPLIFLMLFAIPVRAEVQAEVVNVSLEKATLYPTTTGYSSDYWVREDSERIFFITIRNNGTTAGTFYVGLTIGEEVIPFVGHRGAWCNEECYINPTYRYYDTWMEKWPAILNISANGIETIAVKFKFTTDILRIIRRYENGTEGGFKSGMKLDVVVGVSVEDPTPQEPWKLKLLDAKVIKKILTVTDFDPPPQMTRLKIERVDVPSELSWEDIYNIKVHVRNFGNVSLDKVYVGLTLKQTSPTYSWCNRDCYMDDLGDYYTLENVYPEGEFMAERIFKVRKEKFTVGGSGNLEVGIFNAEHKAKEFALDVVTVPVTISLNLEACPISLRASHKVARVEDIVEYTAYVENRKKTWNFTLYMGIGIWNASKDVEYKVPQTATLSPCNIECYKDNLGDLVFMTIPTGFSAPFTRRMTIPSYFPPEIGIDVLVGVFGDVKKDPKTEHLVGEVPICFVYFKNVTFISSEPSLTETIGETLNRGVDNTVEITARMFGMKRKEDLILVKNFLWGIFSIIVTAGIGLMVREPRMIGLTFMVMLIIGTFLGWFPVWVTIIVSIIAGFLLVRVIGREVF
jgi:hypothetical protein